MTPSNDLPDLAATPLPGVQEESALSEADRRALAGSAMRRCWALAGGLIAASALALSACVPSAPVPPPPAPAPSPTPAPTPTPAPAPSADWQGIPLTRGDWRYVADGKTTRALFGAASSGARFIVACDRTLRQVSLVRPAELTRAAPVTITTTETARTLPTVLGATSNPPQAVATLAAHDATLDAIVFTRGRFMVQIPGTAALYLPSWPEIARVVEDCR